MYPPRPPPLQTKKGKNARGITSEEFGDLVGRLQDKWDELERQLPRGERDGKPIFSWDNCRAHGSVLDDETGWENYDILPCEHTLLPRYSGDMHSVIEAAHGHLMKVVQPKVDAMKATTLPPYIELTQKLFYEHCSVKWVQSTTHRLYITVLPGVLEAGGLYSEDRQKR